MYREFIIEMITRSHTNIVTGIVTVFKFHCALVNTRQYTEADAFASWFKCDGFFLRNGWFCSRSYIGYYCRLSFIFFGSTVIFYLCLFCI
jgi:hypothetical protein